MDKRYTSDWVTKTEFNEGIQRLAAMIFKHYDEFQSFKKTVATKDDVNLILNRIDNFTLRIETFDRKVLVHDDRLGRIESQIASHDSRISSLESTR